MMRLLVFTCALSLVLSGRSATPPVGLELFFMRHVESQWNCWDNINKDTTLSTDPEKTAQWKKMDCPWEKVGHTGTIQEVGWKGRFLDASPSKRGGAQLNNIYLSAGRSLFGDAVVGEAAKLQTILKDLPEGKKVAFLTSNLRRAQLTTLALRGSLLKKASRLTGGLAPIKDKLDAANFQIAVALQETGPGLDAWTRFVGDLQKPPPAANFGPTQRSIWQTYLHDDKEGRDSRYPSGKNAKAVFDKISGSNLPAYTYETDALPALLKKMVNDENIGAVIIGGHSDWFKSFVKTYGTGKKKWFKEYSEERKLDNGELVRVNLKITPDETVDAKVIEIQKIDFVWKPEAPKLADTGTNAGQSSLAMSEFENVLRDEHDALEEFGTRQEHQIELLRNAAMWREWMN